jgi:LEA14-like dessication related protein
MGMVRSGAVFLMVVVLAACTGTRWRPQPPEVNVADLRLESLTLFEQTFEVKLRLRNPNSFEIPINGLEYTVYLNDDRLASGASDRSVTVPAYGSEILVTELTTSTIAFVNQFGKLGNIIGKPLNYTVKGSVELAGRGRRLPFEHSGVITPTRGEGAGI